MAKSLTLLLTDYSQVQPKLRLMAKSVVRNTGYITTSGNTAKMKATTDVESIDGITRLISQDIFKNRYMQVVCMSLRDENDTLRYVEIPEIENTMQLIDDAYTKQYPVLFINIIPWQINRSSDMKTKEAPDALDLFRKWGFIDVGSKTIDDIVIPEYIMVKFNDIGHIPFTIGEEIW